jgi:hypothetical protein
MSLRAAALVLGRRSNLGILQGIASGKKQDRPRNDIGKKRETALKAISLFCSPVYLSPD